MLPHLGPTLQNAKNFNTLEIDPRLSDLYKEPQEATRKILANLHPIASQSAWKWTKTGMFEDSLGSNLQRNSLKNVPAKERTIADQSRIILPRSREFIWV